MSLGLFLLSSGAVTLLMKLRRRVSADASKRTDAEFGCTVAPTPQPGLSDRDKATIQAAGRFWFGVKNPTRPDFTMRNGLWFRGGPDIDGHIQTTFGAAISAAVRGKLDHWATAEPVLDTDDPSRTHSPLMALVLLLDQFPRNAFRGKSKSFAGDTKAVEVVVVRRTGARRRLYNSSSSSSSSRGCALSVVSSYFFVFVRCFLQHAVNEGRDVALSFPERMFLFVACVPPLRVYRPIAWRRPSSCVP